MHAEDRVRLKHLIEACEATTEFVDGRARIDTRRIPYKGSSPAFNDLLAGQVQYCIEAVPIGLQHVKSARLLALATTGKKRLPFLPDVPALNETLPGLGWKTGTA